MRQANRAIMRERHITPTLEDILQEVTGSKFFSTLDLNQAFHQIELDQESRYITTFSTHMGLYRYKRLFFGVNSASEIFHNIIRERLSDIKGVMNAHDDILIHGKTKDEHDERLTRVRQRLTQLNLTTQKEKEQICKTKIKFWGVIISANGLEPDPSKVDNICNFESPKTPEEVQSFLGMINYCGRFIRNLSDVSEPLRKASTLKGANFKWTTECEKAFQHLKDRLRSTKKLAFFKTSKQTQLIVDASPIGLGAILSQTNTDGKQEVIAYASKTLTATEQRYSQTEREALAIIWGCEHFRIYLLGIQFTTYTDHKPLVTIFNKASANLSPRMERWMIRKQPFNMEVKYLKGAENAADFLSRHPKKEEKESELTKAAEAYVNFISTRYTPVKMTTEEIATDSLADPVLQAVKQALSNHKWPIENEEVMKFFKYRDELSVTKQGIILRATRICVPKKLQQKAIDLAHEGHQGIARTKQLLRTKVWFPGIDKEVETRLKSCMPCLLTTSENNRAPIKMSDLPTGPWKNLSMDFFTLPDGEELMVIIDDYSKFPIVEEIPSVSARTVIKQVNNILATFGIPDSIRTDNGPPFNSRQFADNAIRLGFQHRKVTPLWPEANGEAERFMRTLKRAIATAKLSRLNWKEELHNFLRNYRSTLHPAIGTTPAEALFGRNMSNKLPETSNANRNDQDKEMRRHHEHYTSKVKQYADNKRQTKPHFFRKGDLVVLKNEKRLPNKLEPRYKEDIYRVQEVRNDTLILLHLNTGKTYSRNVSLVKRWHNLSSKGDETELAKILSKKEEEEGSDEETEPLIQSNKRNNEIPVNNPTANNPNQIVDNSNQPADADDNTGGEQLPERAMPTAVTSRPTPRRCTVRTGHLDPLSLQSQGGNPTPETPRPGEQPAPQGRSRGRGQREKKSTQNPDFVY